MNDVIYGGRTQHGNRTIARHTPQQLIFRGIAEDSNFAGTIPDRPNQTSMRTRGTHHTFVANVDTDASQDGPALPHSLPVWQCHAKSVLVSKIGSVVLAAASILLLSLAQPGAAQPVHRGVVDEMTEDQKNEAVRGLLGHGYDFVSHLGMDNKVLRPVLALEDSAQGRLYSVTYKPSYVRRHHAGNSMESYMHDVSFTQSAGGRIKFLTLGIESRFGLDSLKERTHTFITTTDEIRYLDADYGKTYVLTKEASRALGELKRLKSVGKNLHPKYEAFFARFGTHVITRASIGGSIEYNHATENLNSQIGVELGVKTDGEARGIIHGGSTYELVTNHIDERGDEQWDITVYGGDPALALKGNPANGTREDYREWAETIGDYPALTFVDPVQDLIAIDTIVQNGRDSFSRDFVKTLRAQRDAYIAKEGRSDDLTPVMPGDRVRLQMVGEGFLQTGTDTWGHIAGEGTRYWPLLSTRGRADEITFGESRDASGGPVELNDRVVIATSAVGKSKTGGSSWKDYNKLYGASAESDVYWATYDNHNNALWRIVPADNTQSEVLYYGQQFYLRNVAGVYLSRWPGQRYMATVSSKGSATLFRILK